ncbi:MAG: ABC transporter permease [Prevotellaceae bacterium]|nr:ABC transporter permease [Prevotellaceae bacterium]
MKYRSDVWSLLRRNISKAQLIGYAAANVVGLSVILIGVLFFTDSRHDTSGEDEFFSTDYVVLSKKVEGVGFTPVSFSEQEIASLGQQPWVRKIGRFTASQFAVNGTVSMGGKGLSSYMFLEAVPDEFFDVKPRGWSFNPVEGFVPIILCKDYLTLYNFGFAIPQGLPQVSEQIIGAVPITLRLTGKDMQAETFKAGIVGFSSRLNTIAVPQSFMDWANERYGDGTEPPASRLIVEVDPLLASDMKTYLAQNEIEMAGDKQDTGRLSSFLGIVSAVVASGGIVICALAIFILILSIFLLLQKSRDKLRFLMLLGYRPREVARYYELLVVLANVAVTLVSLSLALLARTLWSEALANIGLGGASLLPTLLLTLVYLLGVTLLDVGIVRSRVMQIWRGR